MIFQRSKTLEIPISLDDLVPILKRDPHTRYRDREFKVKITPRYGYRLLSTKIIVGKILSDHAVNLSVRPTIPELLVMLSLVFALLYCVVLVIASGCSVAFLVAFALFVVGYFALAMWHMKDCLDSYCEKLRTHTEKDSREPIQK